MAKNSSSIPEFEQRLAVIQFFRAGRIPHQAYELPFMPEVGSPHIVVGFRAIFARSEEDLQEINRTIVDRT